MVSEGIQNQILYTITLLQYNNSFILLSRLNQDLFVCFGRFIQTIMLTDIP